MTSPPDAQDRPTFDEMAEPLLDRAWGYALSIVENRSDAEDAVQDALLRGLQGFSRFDPSLSFKAWWFRIVRNCSIDLLRRRRSRPRQVPLEVASEIASTEVDTEDWERLTQMLSQLPPKHWEILDCRYFGDLSYREIAAVLEIPLGTVMSRLHAARRALAEIYPKEEP